MLGGLQVMKHFSANLWSYFTKKDLLWNKYQYV